MPELPKGYPREWEWEYGDGFTILLTHDAMEARTRALDYLQLIHRSLKIARDYLPPLSEFQRGKKVWVSVKVLNDDDETHWKTYKRWWFGRIKVLLVG